MSKRTFPLVLAASLCSGLSAASPALPSALEAGWNGRPVCELMHEARDYRALRCSFAPGVGHERHFHPAHFGYALSGGRMRTTDESGTREIALATGSRFSSDGVGWHEVINVGDTTVIYMIIEDR